MLIAVWSVVFAIGGVLMWALAANPVLKRMGELAYLIGLFFTVQVLAMKTLSLGNVVVAVWAVVFILAGVLMWVLAASAILKKIGEYNFAVGLFFLVQALAKHTFKLF